MKEKRTRTNRRAELAKRLFVVKERYKDHKYLDNILKRERHDSEYHEIRIKFRNQIVCFYCGERATGVDHQPPISCIDDYVSVCKSKEKEVRLIKVSCCAECNRLLGRSLYSTFEIKLTVLRKRLKRKYETIDKTDKAAKSRLRRRMIFDKGLARIKGRYE